MDEGYGVGWYGMRWHGMGQTTRRGCLCSQSFCQMSYGVKAARDVVINHGQQKRGASPRSLSLSLYRETRQIEVA